MEAKKVITERTKEGKILKYQYLVGGKPVPEGYKYCPACQSVKLKSDFTAKGNACKPCANKRARDHRLIRRQDPEYVKQHNAAIVKRNREQKQKAIEHLGGKCTDCGEKFPNSVYDFHHVDMNTKEGNPSAFLVGDWEKAKEELSKCVLLCSNCHRIRHFEGG